MRKNCVCIRHVVEIWRITLARTHPNTHTHTPTPTHTKTYTIVLTHTHTPTHTQRERPTHTPTQPCLHTLIKSGSIQKCWLIAVSKILLGETGLLLQLLVVVPHWICICYSVDDFCEDIGRNTELSRYSQYCTMWYFIKLAYIRPLLVPWC